MGGHALKTVTTVRKPLNEYNLIKEHVLNVLHIYGLEAESVLELPGKTDFGDLDVIVKFNQNPRDIVQQFHPREIVVSGDVYSFDFRFSENDEAFQIDLIKVHNIEMAQFYLGYSDIGSILGRIVNCYALKFGHVGLWAHVLNNTIHPDKKIDQRCEIGKVMLSESPQEICTFLGLDYEKYKSGFESKISIFQWIMQCTYFNPDYFKQLKYEHRRRSVMRPFYIDFLKYINVSVSDVKPLDNCMDGCIKKNIQMFAISHFNKEKDLEYLLLKNENKNQMQEKFNGRLFLERGIEPKEIGKTICQFKESIGTTFDEWIMSYSKEEIIVKIDLFLGV